MSRPSPEGYKLVSHVGEGALGPRYIAKRIRSGGQRASIKILELGAGLDRDRVAMAFNQALAASALGHPHIVEVLDMGWLSDGRPYLVTELLRGESLAERLRRSWSLPPTQVVALARQIASALGAAHEEGIVHGALDPSHLFLIKDPSAPGGESVKVLAFGAGALAVDLTSPFVAPERRGPGAAGIDARADQYALGAILHEALCGIPPSSAGAELSLRALDSAVPPEVEATVVRALAVDPTQRFASMAQLSDALGPPGDARPSPPPRSGRRRALRFAVPSVLLAACVAACLSLPSSTLHRLGRNVLAVPTALLKRGAAQSVPAATLQGAPSAR
jgi:serine/threonine protein kinase